MRLAVGAELGDLFPAGFVVPVEKQVFSHLDHGLLTTGTAAHKALGVPKRRHARHGLIPLGVRA